MKELKVNVENGVKILEYRSGEAPIIHDSEEVVFSGTIETPLRFLEKPSANFMKNITDSRVEVNESDGTIKLVVNENIHPTDVYKGKLEYTEEFLRFGINSGKSYSTFDLANLFKMNRSFFETKDEAMKLVNDLRSFKAKVDQDIERSDDTRGNATVKKVQAVESNVPQSFKLNLPIFKGEASQKFEVEIAIDAGDLSCSLVSPDANDYQQSIKQTILGYIVQEIGKLFPELRIFNL